MATDPDRREGWRSPGMQGVEHPIDADDQLPFLVHLGVKILPGDREDPTSYAELELRDDLRNLAGFMQGGVVATLLDVAAGVTAARAAGTGQVLTQDLHISYLRPVRIGPARCVGTVMRSGKRSVTVQAEVFDLGGDDPDAVCTFATSTFSIVGPPED